MPSVYSAVVSESYVLPAADQALLHTLPVDVQAHPTIQYLLDGRDYSDFLAFVQAAPAAWSKEDTLAILQPRILAEKSFSLLWARLYGRQYDISLGMGDDSLTPLQHTRIMKYVRMILSNALRTRAVRVLTSSKGDIYLELNAQVHGQDIYWNFYFTGLVQPLLRASVSERYSSIKELLVDGAYHRPDPAADGFASPGSGRMRVRRTVTYSEHGSPGDVPHLRLPAEKTSPGQVPPAAASPPLSIAYDDTKSWNTADFVDHMDTPEHRARLKDAGYMHEDLPGVAAQIKHIVGMYPWLLMPHWYTLGGAAKNKTMKMRTEQAFWIPLYKRKVDMTDLVPHGLPVLYLTLTPKHNSSGALVEYKLSTGLLPDMIIDRVLASPASTRINQEAEMTLVPFEEAAAAAAAGSALPFEAVLIARAAEKEARTAIEKEAELRRAAKYQARVAAEAESRTKKRLSADERRKVAERSEAAAALKKEKRKAAERAKAEAKRLKRAEASILQAARNAYMRVVQSGEGVPRDALEAALDLGFATHRVAGEEYTHFREAIRAKMVSFMCKQEKKAAASGVTPHAGAGVASTARKTKRKKKPSGKKGGDQENRYLPFSPSGKEGERQAASLAEFEHRKSSSGALLAKVERGPLRDLSLAEVRELNARFHAKMAAADEEESD